MAVSSSTSLACTRGLLTSGLSSRPVRHSIIPPMFMDDTKSAPNRTSEVRIVYGNQQFQELIPGDSMQALARAMMPGRHDDEHGTLREIWKDIPARPIRMQKLSQEAMSFTTLSGITRKAAITVASSCCSSEQSQRAYANTTQ